MPLVGRVLLLELDLAVLRLHRLQQLRRVLLRHPARFFFPTGAMAAPPHPYMCLPTKKKSGHNGVSGTSASAVRMRRYSSEQSRKEPPNGAWHVPDACAYACVQKRQPFSAFHALFVFFLYRAPPHPRLAPDKKCSFFENPMGPPHKSSAVIQPVAQHTADGACAHLYSRV